ncbi:queuosine precursor transporter [Bacillus sp. Marseille-P3800]|uniref:queuosine precursor transporter n=1 Tax=Bacillus sp. Marseille-P3800 TaxID=2014782 RepID=UPI000C0720AE|nr:queuosine precursor transporter [Bacillus sp. Marseille-P3800]
MPTEILGLLFAIANFSFLVLFYKLFGKTGIITWIGFAAILANLQVLKTIELFGLIVTMGNVMYATTFLATDLLNEKYGKAIAKKAVWLGFSTLLVSTIIMQFVLLFPPHGEDLAHDHLAFIFDFALRVALGSLTAFLISNHINIYIFAFFKKLFPNMLWLRNIVSSIFGQALDTLIFCAIAFLGVYSMCVWFEIALTTYIMKFIVSLLAMPFIYWARSIKPLQD